MCKIILQFSEKFTRKDLEGHREMCEKGAGVISVDNNQFRIAKDMEHEKMYNLLFRQAWKSPFYLFHSRMPSAGSVNWTNIQPFYTDTFAFCHIVTISMRDLQFACMGAKISYNSNDSDSVLLYKLIKDCPINSIKSFLWSLDQNFIFATMNPKIVYLIGHFDLIGKKINDKNYVVQAKNKYFGRKYSIEMDFHGKVIEWKSDKETANSINMSSYYDSKKKEWVTNNAAPKNTQLDFLGEPMKEKKIESDRHCGYNNDTKINGVLDDEIAKGNKDTTNGFTKDLSDGI